LELQVIGLRTLASRIGQGALAEDPGSGRLRLPVIVFHCCTQRTQLPPPTLEGGDIVGIHLNEWEQRINTVGTQPAIERPTEAAEVRVAPVAQRQYPAA